MALVIRPAATQKAAVVVEPGYDLQLPSPRPVALDVASGGTATPQLAEEVA
jgi:hypothetical protein